VDHYDDDWTVLWWVRVSGQGRVVDRGPARDAAVDLLATKYEQYRDQRPAGPVLVINITRIISWQATTGCWRREPIAAQDACRHHERYEVAPNQGGYRARTAHDGRFRHRGSPDRGGQADGRRCAGHTRDAGR